MKQKISPSLAIKLNELNNCRYTDIQSLKNKPTDLYDTNVNVPVNLQYVKGTQLVKKPYFSYLELI